MKWLLFPIRACWLWSTEHWLLLVLPLIVVLVAGIGGWYAVSSIPTTAQRACCIAFCADHGAVYSDCRYPIAAEGRVLTCACTLPEDPTR